LDSGAPALFGNFRQMSERNWFLDKADECARRAKEAADPRLRSTLETERALWLRIAEKSLDEPSLLTKPEESE
jgi:hypothetical protein